MTCSIPGVCSHSPDCTDHNCPGRSTAEDGLESVGEVTVWLLVGMALVAIGVVFGIWLSGGMP